MKEKILVIGGSGFIGYHIIQELRNSNYEVWSSSRNPIFKENKHTLYIHLKEMSDEELGVILQDFDFIIFAGGVDDRTMADGDATTFFYNGNIVPCVRLATICKGLKLQKLIILGSYFSHFNRIRPEWKMAVRHPYVRSRKLQQEETVKAAQGKTKIITLDLPYIFGSCPDKIPLWKPLINYIRKSPIIFYTKGGTNIISVEQVAKATLGAIKNAEHGENWQVGGQNVTWKEMISLIASALGKEKVVVSIPNFIVRFFALLVWGYFLLRKKESGLNPFYFVTTQCSETFLDSKKAMKELNYASSNMQNTINETVKACNFKDKRS
jgi:dihydroflavonol-4-reductase